MRKRSQIKVWRETEIQEMLLNQHFLDFPLKYCLYSFFLQIYKQGYDSTFQDYVECII